MPHPSSSSSSSSHVVFRLSYRDLPEDAESESLDDDPICNETEEDLAPGHEWCIREYTTSNGVLVTKLTQTHDLVLRTAFAVSRWNGDPEKPRPDLPVGITFAKKEKLSSGLFVQFFCFS